MNSQPENESSEGLAAKAREAAAHIKDAAREKVLEPLAEASRNAAGNVREGIKHAADQTRHAVERSREWAVENPCTTAILCFAAGLLAGGALALQCTASKRHWPLS
ncbi:MAG TPA: hypothetical protein VG796_05845 [Verrucomicrobiales bacterium]|nr:hypothetical protein [Verrucomicrobiales bacterium]